MAETWVLSVSNMCIITLPYCRFRDSYSTAAPQILCWHVCWLNTLLTLLMHKFESIWGPVSLQVGKWISGAEQQIAEPFVLDFKNGWSVSACLSQAWMLPVSALQHITMPYTYSIILLFWNSEYNNLKTWFRLQSPCCRLRCVSQRLVVEPIIMKACMAKLGNLPPTNKRTE